MNIYINDLSLTINSADTLRGLNLHLKPSVTVIHGGNGVGKTSFLRLLATPVTTHRSIQLEGVSLVSFMGVSSAGLTDELRCEEILALFCKLKRASVQPNPIYDGSTLKSVLPLRTSELSNGMRQLFKYYLHSFWNPDVLLLDEPFSFLDEENRTLIVNDLMQRKQNSIVVIATQSALREATWVDFRLELGRHA